ncbi:unnamed protein product [Gongylonema pulchrum]|uniref:SWIM-type domain-containing protein n=1 Tax=Gongylonema pulchrum TaxID=637853 RepID=A0A183E8Y7_9BILA|nr:unnamed protein product [Gongylonema pulchrum]
MFPERSHNKKPSAKQLGDKGYSNLVSPNGARERHSSGEYSISYPSSRTYVRLLNPMTFAVRAGDGVPHFVEVTHHGEADDVLQWYCSCELRLRCAHIISVMLVHFPYELQKINDSLTW